VEKSVLLHMNRWLPPFAPFLKLNVAWRRFKVRNSFGVGVVFRNHTGAPMAAYCEEVPNVKDGLHMANATSIKALQFCTDAGFSQVIVEFTHSHFLALILSKEVCLTELGDKLNLI
jgi:hypothetical protein